MKLVLKVTFWSFRLIFSNRHKLVLENLALRQQLSVQQRNIKRIKLRKRDRIFWYLFSQFWNDWKPTLCIIKPETVVKWHRNGFKLFWRWKSRSKPGKPMVSKEIRDLIKRMASENPTWELQEFIRNCVFWDSILLNLPFPNTCQKDLDLHHKTGKLF